MPRMFYSITVYTKISFRKFCSIGVDKKTKQCVCKGFHRTLSSNVVNFLELLHVPYDQIYFVFQYIPYSKSFCRPISRKQRWWIHSVAPDWGKIDVRLKPVTSVQCKYDQANVSLYCTQWNKAFGYWYTRISTIYNKSKPKSVPVN